MGHRLVGAAGFEPTTLDSGFSNDFKGQFPESLGDQPMQADAGGGVSATEVAMVGTFEGTVISWVV
jgi:hypothetical protein